MLVEQNVVCPVLIGRDATLSAGWYALERAHESHGGTLLVSGEAGIGKSRYARAMAEHARTLEFMPWQPLQPCRRNRRSPSAARVGLVLPVLSQF